MIITDASAPSYGALRRRRMNGYSAYGAPLVSVPSYGAPLVSIPSYGYFGDDTTQANAASGTGAQATGLIANFLSAAGSIIPAALKTSGVGGTGTSSTVIAKSPPSIMSNPMVLIGGLALAGAVGFAVFKASRK